MAARSSPRSSRRTAPGPGAPLIVGADELRRRTIVTAAAAASRRRPPGGGAAAPSVRRVAGGRALRRHDDEGRPVTLRPRGMRTHLCGELRPEHVETPVSLCGWVARRREHGEHLAFVDLRDHTGIVQCVVDGSVDVRSEWVVARRGHGAAPPRGHGQPRAAHRRGRARRLRGRGPDRGRAAAVPGRRPGRGRRVGAPAVPLRGPAPAPHAARTCACAPGCIGAMRAAMDRQGFCEVETPLLWTPTPEGAREFAVPSRLHRGSSTCCPRAPRSPSSCSWWRASTATSRSPAACATRTCGPTASSSSPSSTSRRRS